tara:strand:- start:6978 stop:7442 length:465 start_codon:yes stop_codon:yes gene_type:complete
MKIRITVGEKQKLNGYTNIDPITKFDDIAIDIRNLDELVSDAECTEIISEGVIDFLNRGDFVIAINNWVKKMRHGGKIIVTSIDALEVAKAFSRKEIDIEVFNQAIHGNLSSGWDVLLSHTTLEELSSILEKLGLTVTKKRINGIKLIVEAERP